MSAAESIDEKLARVTARIKGQTGSRIDYRDRKNWRKSEIDKDGNPVHGNVIITIDGRYTIVEIPPTDEKSNPRYQAFRRKGPPEIHEWQPPTWCHVYPTADLAREACQFHAAQEAAKR